VTEATHIRSWTPDLEVRSDGDGRTVSGIAVPYNLPQRINESLTEVFLPGAFRAQMRAAHRVKFSREHLRFGGTLIGRLELMRDDAKGLYVEARVATTEAGDETLELVKAGALDELSIGFAERQSRRRPDGVVERRTAHLAEVSVVLAGAYGQGARVQAVRHGGTLCAACGGSAATAPDERAGLAAARAVLAGLPAHLPVS
jgi:HK97 family phage prohead protease